MTARVGIDDLNLYAGPLALRFADVAKARGLDRKALDMVRFDHRSVLPPQEDSVTLAINAATPLVEAHGADAFELLIVATESAVDDGKPLSTYVHRHLGLAGNCRNFEIKHACYGGTAALHMAAAWIRSQEAPGKKALVVMTDVSRRHFGDLSELTGGVGAVALCVSEHPRVLELEGKSGYASLEIYDVARPTRTGEYGDSVLSLHAYMDLLEMAWSDYQARNAATSANPEDHFRYVLYHTPLVSLTARAHRMLLEDALDDLSETRFQESYDRMVAPSLALCREVGNIYSGSLYAALAGLLERFDVAAGTRIGMFSYGSGSASEFFCGTVGAEACERIRKRRLGEALGARRNVSVSTYERLVEVTEASMTSQEFVPDDKLGLVASYYKDSGRLALTDVENHYRSYARL